MTRAEASLVSKHLTRAAWLMFAVVACGPSLTTVHEGTIRFEHCYRLDLEPNEGKAQRKDCWKLWLGSYTYGQSRDRIDYARRRLHSLENGNDTQPELKVAGEHRPESRQFYLVMPGPTSVHAPPPPIATVEQPAPNAKTATDTAVTEKPPADGCAGDCREDWESCCSADAGVGCEPCQKKYTACMRGCFR